MTDGSNFFFFLSGDLAGNLADHRLNLVRCHTDTKKRFSD